MYKIKDIINKIHNNDCLKFMRKMSDKSVDLVLTDPPYGINENNEKNLSRGILTKPKDYGHYDWDKKKIEKKYFDEIFRISKNQIIFGGNYYGSILGDTSCYIVWDKNNGNNDFADCELAWTSFKTAVRKYKYTWNGMIQENMKNKEYRYHPTQKPVGLFSKIIEDYSKENDLILDPFLGSGTTAVACQNLHRNFIGIEKEEKYCKISRERLRQHPML